MPADRLRLPLHRLVVAEAAPAARAVATDGSDRGDWLRRVAA